MKRLFFLITFLVTVVCSGFTVETAEAYGTGAAFVPPVYYKTIPLHDAKRYHEARKSRYEVTYENNNDRTTYYYPYYNYSLPLYISYPSYGWYRYPSYGYYRPYYVYRYDNRYRYNHHHHHYGGYHGSGYHHGGYHHGPSHHHGHRR